MLKKKVSANGQPTSTADQDLVVVDRKTLIKLINAIMCSLDSSQALDMIASRDSLDTPKAAEKRDQITTVRTEIAKGVRSLKAGIEELPSITVERPAEAKAG